MSQIITERYLGITPTLEPLENAYIADKERQERVERSGTMTAIAATLMLDSVLDRFSENTRSEVSEEGKVSTHTPLIILGKSENHAFEDIGSMRGVVLGKEQTKQSFDYDAQTTFIAAYLYKLDGKDVEQLTGEPIRDKAISETAEKTDTFFYNLQEMQDYLDNVTTVKKVNKGTRNPAFEKAQRQRANDIYGVISKVGNRTILECMPPIYTLQKTPSQE